MKPPEFIRKNAKEALKCIEKGSQAMTEVGRMRARQLASGKALTKSDLKSMSSFKRHKSNASYSGDKCKDKGAVAWLGWGNSLKNKKGIPDAAKWAKVKLKR